MNSQAPSKELTHEERCERIREIEASFLHRGDMAVEIYRLQHVNGQLHESLKSMHKSCDDWMGECQRIEDRCSAHEPRADLHAAAVAVVATVRRTHDHGEWLLPLSKLMEAVDGTVPPPLPVLVTTDRKSGLNVAWNAIESPKCPECGGTYFSHPRLGISHYCQTKGNAP